MKTDVEIPENMHIESEPPEQGTGPTDTTPDPRKDAMQAIYANRNAQIEKELNLPASADDAPQEGDAPLEPAPAEPAITPAPAPSAEPAAPSTPQAPATDDPNPGAAQSKKYQLAVNGRVIEMGEDDVVKAAQRVLSADERYQQASAMRNEAIQLRNQPPAQSAPVNDQTTQRQSQFDPMTLIDDKKADEFIRKINYGSDEEQRSAIRELGASIATGIEGRAANNPTPDQVAEYATQQALARINFQNNLQAIGNEFKELFLSRPLTIAAADTVGQLRTQYAAQGVQKTEVEIYREACQSISDQFLKRDDPPSPEPATAIPVQAAQPATSGNRFERKRAAPQPPAAATMVATDNPKPKGFDPSTIVQQMRKSRGQSAF